ncbi:hypothetical protein QF026_000784 [Streptomyces aurantiacus]|nr:hypothetical protein [Streptomyces aurantiacus]
MITYYLGRPPTARATDTDETGKTYAIDTTDVAEETHETDEVGRPE